MKKDFITEETIKLLVDSFYSKVRNDTKLSPIFFEVIGEEQNWPGHMEIMCKFWSAIMLGSNEYKGTPLQKHRNLPSFDISLFNIWLDLFAQTVHEIHTQDIAKKYISKSRMIANSLKFGLYGLSDFTIYNRPK